MQIKPQFNDFEILDSYEIIKDDTGDTYSLVHYKGKTVREYATDAVKTVTTIEEDGWSVISENIKKWSNGATSRSNDLFWKDKSRNFIVGEYKGIRFEEIPNGQHSMFSESDHGLKTTFRVYAHKRTKNS